MVRRPFRTSRSLLVSLGLLVVVALILGVVAVGRGVWSDPRSVTEDSTTSSTEAPTTSPGGPPPTTRSPGPVARIIQWLNAYAPLAGGAGGAEDEAFSRLLAGECQGVLTLSEATTPGDRLAEPARSLYEGAASACLAAFEGRRELWPRAEAAYARLGGQTGRLACETRTVYPLLQRILEAHHADPNVRLVKRSGGRGVLRCPRFTKITPNHGPAAGGYQVRIEGQHLPPVVGVNIDFDLRVEAARQDGQQVVITMPPAPPNVNPEELVTIWPDDAPIYELGAAVDFSYDPPAGTTSTATTAQLDHVHHPTGLHDLVHYAGATLELTMVEIARDQPASTEPTAPARDDPPTASSAGGAGAALRLIATVGSPIAIATGLLFYFGWVRASVQAKRLGYDTAILDWSIQDYILRSINVLFIPLMTLLVVALLLLWLHQRLVLRIVTSGRPGTAARWLPRALRASWLMWVAVGITLVVIAEPLSGAIIPATITLALLCALYGDLLERRMTGETRTSTAATALLLILLAFSMFWNTERLARVMGEGYADQIVSNPRQLLAVTVYSPKSLEIDVHGVVETKLGTAESAYRYRYEGLRLVQRSGDRYLLMSERWDAGSSRIIVLRDSNAIRLEFAR